ncbi:MAG: T9SS type A sorting domain-containing protein [Bacteroidales bacterium]|nr:T9SS type A sorting domain-containing protein [Bacteroidales bacterium]
MKKQTFLLIIICTLLITTNAQTIRTKTVCFDPIITLNPIDSLTCEYFNFETYHWLPYQIEAEVQNSDEIHWTSSGDGTFDDESIAAPHYFIGKNDLLANAVVLSVTASGNNTTITADLALGIPLQLIHFTKEGWTGFSSYVDKSDTPVPAVMMPVVDHLNIMINKQGISFWPEPVPPINNLGNWSAIGYQGKFFNPPACLPIYGSPLADQTFLVDGTFTYLPVFTDYPVLIEELFGDNIQKVFEIHDWKDSLTWTPTNAGFEYLKPGMAYRLLLEAGSQPFTLQFPPYSWDLPLKIQGPAEPETTVFPNPSTGVFTVTFSDQIKHAEYSIFNSHGGRVFKGITDERLNIDMSSQPKGLYYLKINYDGSQIVKKLLIR